jgi:type III secretory pathway component EscT
MLYKTKKSQISSTKLQINLKSQYSMTQTFATPSFYCLAYSDLQLMLLQGTSQIDHLFGILNLSHWDLFGIWFLVLGILVYRTNQVIIPQSVDNWLN